MPRLIKAILFLLVIAAPGYAVYKRLAPPAAMQQGMDMSKMPPPAVAVMKAERRDVRIWSEFSGRLAAVERAQVRPRVSGVIESVHFVEGAKVQKGDLLFTLDKRPYEVEVRRAEGVLAAAQAQADLLGGEARRAAKLLKDKALSQSEHDRRQGEAAAAQAGLKAAQAALDGAKLALEYAEVRAPISGRAGRAEVKAGNLVEAGGNAPVLVTIVSDDPIYATFEMDEAAFLRYMRMGLDDARTIPVELGLAAETGRTRTGHIESFDNALDPSTGTIRVRAVFENADGALVPGLFARLLVGSPDTAEVTLVSDRAVSTDQSRKYVLVVGEGNVTEYRPVTLGGMAGGLRIVEEGLSPGETVVLDPIIMRVRPGMPVTPEPEDAKAEPAKGAGQ